MYVNASLWKILVPKSTADICIAGDSVLSSPCRPAKDKWPRAIGSVCPSLLLSSNVLFSNGNPKKLLQTQNCEKTLITSWPNKLVVAHDCWNQKVVLLVVCELELDMFDLSKVFLTKKFRVSISKRETCVFPDGPKRTIATKPPVVALPLRLMLASGVLPSFCSPATTSLQPTGYRTKSRRDTHCSGHSQPQQLTTHIRNLRFTNSLSHKSRLIITNSLSHNSQISQLSISQLTHLTAHKSHNSLYNFTTH